MVRVLQVAIILALLCSSLLGDETDYGVKKWPTPLGSSLEWGMKTVDARAVMKKKGFTFLTESGTDERPEQVFLRKAGEEGGHVKRPGFVSSNSWYRGRFAGSNAVVSFEGINGRLASMRICLGHSEAYKFSFQKEQVILRPRDKPLQTAFKVRDTFVKKYGEPSNEFYLQGPKGIDIMYKDLSDMLEKAQTVSKNKALSEKFEDIYYYVEYETKVHDVVYYKGRNIAAGYEYERLVRKGKVPYLVLKSSNKGTFVVEAKGPLGLEFFSDVE